MILVSACLAGADCAWDGRNRLNPEIKDMVDRKIALAVCPELLGGRGVPRAKTEIKGGDGKDVLMGRAIVHDEKGEDVTSQFIEGAYKCLEIAKKNNVTRALLKAKSPSCGVGSIYDGRFKMVLTAGDGVAAALLKRENIICAAI